MSNSLSADEKKVEDVSELQQELQNLRESITRKDFEINQLVSRMGLSIH